MKVTIIENLQGAECGCGGPAPVNLKYRCVKILNKVRTPAGEIDIIPYKWSFGDHSGALAVRFGVNRMNYAIKPGLYGIGSPTPKSPVFVSSNYKLSFNILKKNLKGIDAWILVLDTKGVNVWCSAGKGTFGTRELINRINITKLSKIVSGKTLILPQLSATGVSAHMVRKYSGFNVIYGPVRAEDIKKFLANRMKASKEMRRVEFNFKDRLVVSSLDFSIAALIVLIISLCILVANYFLKMQELKIAIFIMWISVLTGSIFVPILLPYIPFKAFSLKGIISGIVFGAVLIFVLRTNLLLSLSILLIISSLSGYLAFVFTGSTTFTSFSGVKKETVFALPLIRITLIAGILLYVINFIYRIRL